MLHGCSQLFTVGRYCNAGCISVDKAFNSCRSAKKCFYIIFCAGKLDYLIIAADICNFNSDYIAFYTADSVGITVFLVVLYNFKTAAICVHYSRIVSCRKLYIKRAFTVVKAAYLNVRSIDSFCGCAAPNRSIYR